MCLPSISDAVRAAPVVCAMAIEEAMSPAATPVFFISHCDAFPVMPFAAALAANFSPILAPAFAKPLKPPVTANSTANGSALAVTAPALYMKPRSSPYSPCALLLAITLSSIDFSASVSLDASPPFFSSFLLVV